MRSSTVIERRMEITGPQEMGGDERKTERVREEGKIEIRVREERET